jgi:hypothetical protein
VYGKLFKQMYDGSLSKAGWQAVVTLQQLVILADKHGTVDMTPEAISRLTTIPLEHIQVGLDALEQPDPESRTPGEDGRRIVRLSAGRVWGWRIVNYEHYRAIRSAEERREYHKEYWHIRKEKTQQTQQTQHDSTNSTNSSKQDAVGRKEQPTRTRPAATEKPSPFPKTICDMLYETWVSTLGAIQYPAFRKAFSPLYTTQGPRYSHAELVEAIKAHSEYVSGLTPREAGFESPHKFVADIRRWVRLGSMPAQESNGELTERGDQIMRSAL